MKLELFLHAVLQELLAKALPPVLLLTWSLPQKSEGEKE